MHTTTQYVDQLGILEERMYNHLYGKYHHALTLYAMKFVRDKAAAEDIATDIFIALWEKRADFKKENALKSFLYISTRNRCLNHLDKTRYQRRTQQELRYVLDEAGDGVLQTLIRAEKLQTIERVLEALPGKCGIVTKLTFYKGLERQQIAKKLNISKRAVRENLRRGIDIIKRRLEYEQPDMFR